MRIKSMTATFGRLEKARLELGPGLNLIHAPNEGGKSTWAAFWRTMLYGIDTRDRDKKGWLADKNRYQPWSGAPMEGEITLELGKRDVTIRRGPRGSTPFGTFSAVYTKTQEPVPGLTASNCGELLTGVGAELFSRSAFLGDRDLSLTAAPELERRDITIRRGPRGNTPFGAFSAVYTKTQEPVPGLTASNCGELLTGAGAELFSRSAFLGDGNLSLTTAPELERRIAALVTSG